MKKLVLLCLISLNTQAAFASSLQDTLKSFGPKAYSELGADEWQNSIEEDSRIKVELKKYKESDSRLSDAYIEELTSKLKSRIFADQKNWLSNPKCESSAKGKFLSQKQVVARENYPNVEEDTIRSFENGFIRIEASGCIKSNSAEQVLAEYMNPKFQTEAIPELKSSIIENNLTCEKTHVLGVGTSRYCYNVQVNNDPVAKTISLHTYNLTNAPTKEAGAPVYFRELLFTFKQVAPNQVAANVVVYIRGPNVPKLVRRYAQSKIEANQTRLFEMLDKKLKAHK